MADIVIRPTPDEPPQRFEEVTPGVEYRKIVKAVSSGGSGGDATAANQTTLNTYVGATNETAAASDTAASGLNGRLQRIAQRITSLIALLPTSLSNNNLRVSVQETGVTQPVSAASLPLPTGAATSANQTTLNTEIGDVVEAAPASDTATSGLNGRLQRIAQRLTSLIALLPTGLSNNNLRVSLQETAITQAISAASLPLPTGAATATNQTTLNTEVGDVVETAPASDTASSGLNGRLQRIAQRLTTAITQIGATNETEAASSSSTSGLNGLARLVASRINSTNALLVGYQGQQSMATSLSVTMASNQTAYPVGGTTVNVVASYTRPADTTQYAAGDALSNSTSSPANLTFSSVARVSGGSGRVLGAVLTDSFNQATKGTFRLRLFATAPVATNDNAALALSDTENDNCIGVIDFNTALAANSGSGTSGNCSYGGTFQGSRGSIGFVCGGGVQDIYGVLEVTNAYTPGSGEIFKIRLDVEQN